MYFHKDEILLSLLTYKGFINDGLSGQRSPAYSHIKQAGTEMLLLLPSDINQRNMSPHHLLSPRPSPLLFKWIGGELWLAGWRAGRFRQGDGVTLELFKLIYCFSIKMYQAFLLSGHFLLVLSLLPRQASDFIRTPLKHFCFFKHCFKMSN